MVNDIIYVIIMGILQGFTEWLPVSSSGHLVLAQSFFAVQERTLFDAILHLATLFAAVIYFRKDLKPLVDIKNSSTHKIIIASIPIILVGFFFSDVIENAFNDTLFVSSLLVINGCVLMINAFMVKDKKNIDENEKKENKKTHKNKNNTKISMKNSIIIGIFQIFALLPGISRSGTTITTGRVLKLDWRTATKFSFFISFLPLAGAAGFKIITDWQEFQPVYILGFIIAFIVGYLSIDLMLRIISMGRFHYFGLYTIILGIIMIIYFSNIN